MITPRDGMNPSSTNSENQHSNGEVALSPGTMVEDFELLNLLGSGPRGSVYLAKRQSRTFTIKLLSSESFSLNILNRLDASLPKSIEHPNLACTLASGTFEGRPFYARSFLRGDSLAEILEGFETSNRTPPQLSPLGPRNDGRPRDGFFTTAIQLVLGALHGLKKAHEGGLLHGRIHPGNMILTPAGRLVLTDFNGPTFDPLQRHQQIPPGTNRKSDPTDISFDSPEVLYLAPEQLSCLAKEEELPVNPTTDVYQIAAVLLHLVLRRVPSRLAQRCQNHLGDIVEITASLNLHDEEELSKDLQRVLKRALAEQPTQRYPDAEEFALELGRLLDLQAPEAWTWEEPDPDEGSHSEEETSSDSISLRMDPGTSANYERPKPAPKPSDAFTQAVESIEAKNRLLPTEEEQNEVEQEQESSSEVQQEEATIQETEAEVSNVVEEAQESSAPVEEDLEEQDTKSDSSEDLQTQSNRLQYLESIGHRKGVDPALESKPSEEIPPSSELIPSPNPLAPQPKKSESTQLIPTLGLDADAGVHTEEELQLLHEPSVAQWGKHSFYRSNTFWIAAVAILMVSSFLVFHILDLRESLQKNEDDAQSLSQSVNKFTQAVQALQNKDLSQAAQAIGEASSNLNERTSVTHSEEVQKLQTLKTKIEEIAKDPLIAQLDDPRPSFRIAVIDEIANEYKAGKRTIEDLKVLAPCLIDQHEAVSSKALQICSNVGLYDLVVETFPLGSSEQEIQLSLDQFTQLVEIFEAGMKKEHEGSKQVLAKFELATLDRLDDTLNSKSENLPSQIQVLPNLKLQSLKKLDRSSDSFVSKWIDQQLKIDPNSIFTHLRRLETRKDCLPKLIDALTQIGNAKAIRSIHRLTVNHSFECGTLGIDSLAKLGRSDLLCDLIYEDLPNSFKQKALELAVTHSSPQGDKALSSLIKTHPKSEVRKIASKALERQDFLALYPDALIAALNDPSTRETVLENIGEAPSKIALPILIRALKSSDVKLRLRLIDVLAKSDDETVLIPLVSQLKETSKQLRTQTLEALKRRGDDRALPLAAGLLEPKHEGLQDLAQSLIEQRVDTFKEDLDLLILALQEILGIQRSSFESHSLQNVRRNLLLRRLQPNFKELDQRIPQRIKDLKLP